MKARQKFEPLKVCRVCNKHKRLSEFHKDAKMRDGISMKCKLCFKLPVSKSRLHEKRVMVDWYRLDHVQKSDYISMWSVLKALKYNLNENIAEQFHKKYGFEYNPVEIEKKPYYSAEDCQIN